MSISKTLREYARCECMLSGEQLEVMANEVEKLETGRERIKVTTDNLNAQAVEQLKRQIDQLTLDHANLLKDLKAVTAHNERIQQEKCSLIKERDELDHDWRTLNEYLEEKLGVTGEHSTFETIDNTVSKLAALTKERDDLAVKLAHAQMDLEAGKPPSPK